MIKAIVTDIEGTTTSLSFVRDVLFPYAREHIATFVHQHADDDEVKLQLDEVRKLSDPGMGLDEVIGQLVQWIDADQKITPLKAIQGMIWADGYQAGNFTGHVYEDAARKLREWHQQGIRLYVFSSGSVAAQKLIFGFSDCGDLTPLFKGYFDTRIGSKRDVAAYQHIVDEIGCAANEALFLSDIEQELKAAKAVGMNTIQLIREGQRPWSGTLHATDFNEIDLTAF